MTVRLSLIVDIVFGVIALGLVLLVGILFYLFHKKRCHQASIDPEACSAGISRPSTVESYEPANGKLRRIIPCSGIASHSSNRTVRSVGIHESFGLPAVNSDSLRHGVEPRDDRQSNTINSKTTASMKSGRLWHRPCLGVSHHRRVIAQRSGDHELDRRPENNDNRYMALLNIGNATSTSEKVSRGVDCGIGNGIQPTRDTLSISRNILKSSNMCSRRAADSTSERVRFKVLNSSSTTLKCLKQSLRMNGLRNVLANIRHLEPKPHSKALFQVKKGSRDYWTGHSYSSFRHAALPSNVAVELKGLSNDRHQSLEDYNVPSHNISQPKNSPVSRTERPSRHRTSSWHFLPRAKTSTLRTTSLEAQQRLCRPERDSIPTCFSSTTIDDRINKHQEIAISNKLAHLQRSRSLPEILCSSSQRRLSYTHSMSIPVSCSNSDPLSIDRSLRVVSTEHVPHSSRIISRAFLGKSLTSMAHGSQTSWLDFADESHFTRNLAQGNGAPRRLTSKLLPSVMAGLDGDKTTVWSGSSDSPLIQRPSKTESETFPSYIHRPRSPLQRYRGATSGPENLNNPDSLTSPLPRSPRTDPVRMRQSYEQRKGGRRMSNASRCDQRDVVENRAKHSRGGCLSFDSEGCSNFWLHKPKQLKSLSAIEGPATQSRPVDRSTFSTFNFITREDIEDTKCDVPEGVSIWTKARSIRGPEPKISRYTASSCTGSTILSISVPQPARKHTLLSFDDFAPTLMSSRSNGQAPLQTSPSHSYNPTREGSIMSQENNQLPNWLSGLQKSTTPNPSRLAHDRFRGINILVSTYDEDKRYSKSGLRLQPMPPILRAFNEHAMMPGEKWTTVIDDIGD